MTSGTIAERLGGASVLNQDVRTDLELVAALQDGLPAESVGALAENGGVSMEELYELVIPRRTLAKRRQLQQRLTLDESDRLTRVARILASADETFQNREKAYRSASTALLGVPSAIVPEEENVLLNSAHEEAPGVRVIGRRPFRFDLRLYS